MPIAASDIPRPVCPAEVVLVNSNRPFWLLVLPGIGCTLIWSKSFSPEYSMEMPALTVCRLFTHVVVFANVLIGPTDEEGYGPPSISLNGLIVIVGILSGISLNSGNRYG